MPVAALDLATAMVALDSPACFAAAVTPSDSADLANPARALWIGSTAGGSGLKITTAGGDTVTLAGVATGVLPIAVARVWSSSTTVTSIIALR